MRTPITALLVTIVSLLAFAPPGRADEQTERIRGMDGEIEVKVTYPGDAYGPWAQVVLGYVRKGLPLLEQAAGFAFPRKEIEIAFADDLADTHGLDAWYVGRGRIWAVRVGRRKGMRGHQILSALGHIYGEALVTEPWLQQAIGYLLTLEALEHAHEIYHAWTFRDELVEDARRAGKPKLEDWKPAGMVPDEYLTAFGEAAFGFAMLFAVDVTLGRGKVLEAVRAMHERKSPGSLFDFMEALEKAADKPVRDLFVGWAYAPGSDDPPSTLNPNAIRDLDDDGLLECEEAAAGTDATSPDTDLDGRLDGEEVHDEHTDPLHADPPRPVRFDGDAKEWLRLKKFKVSDKKGDSRSDAPGTDLHAVALAADADFIYVLVLADTFSNPKVKYTLVFDVQHDKVWDYAIGFRGTRHRWLGVTHNQKDWSWAEWRNDRRMSLWVKEGVAEMRIPRAALELGDKPTFMVYTTIRDENGKTIYADATLREPFDLARWQW